MTRREGGARTRRQARIAVAAPLHRALLGVAAIAFAVSVGGCRHGAPSAPLPGDWSQLTVGPRPFAALYRLSCCARRNLLATVRYDGSHIDLVVGAQPGGALERAWVTVNGGWVLDGRLGCVGRLAAGELPLAEGRSLPLEPDLVAALLSARLPGGATPAAAAPGWVTGVAGDYSWRARVAADPTRVVRLIVARAGTDARALDATLDDFRIGGVPGTLKLDVGYSLELKLVSWRPGGALVEPAWTSGPRCGTGS